jgi:glycosyltransferase involved in cell wall biosynthesis
MKNKSLVIVHFNPVELYPPMINLLDYLGNNLQATDIFVYTNSACNDTIDQYPGKHKNISIKRYGAVGLNFSPLKRYRNYFSFYYNTYISLKKIHPDWLWYFETASALPASWYMKQKKNQSTTLMVHYHEYMSPKEYKSGPLLVKWAHHAEKKLYNLVSHLSQTNEKRMELFLKDEKIVLKDKTYIFPNYPPKSWIDPESNHVIDFPVRVVYAGAIGFQSLFMEEFCKWVHKQNGHVCFDIYSSQDTSELEIFLSGSELKNISIKGYVEYNELPAVLKKYDVGVVLYNGHIPNYVYNAPNKLFEYLACGLDVWFPENMTGSMHLIRQNKYPRITGINFKELDKIDLKSLIDRSGLSYEPSPYYCEKIFEDVTERIFKTAGEDVQVQ